MLQARHSAEAGGAKSGVAQGDPLSMYLFCAAITPMLYEIEEHNPGISLCVYADDILTKNNKYQSLQQLLESIERICAKYGLTVNKRKCKFCINAEDEIKFMGITHSKTAKLETTAAYQLHCKAIEIQKFVNKMLMARIPRHMIFNLFRICLLPRLNWAIGVV
jgi:hypothetical protein